MTVITLASSKGGCGKSTGAVVLAGSFAREGYSVRLIDADPRQRVLRWAEQGEPVPNITAVGADASTIIAQIGKGRSEAEIIIIDVEGSANQVVTLAVGQSNLVIIPANQSAPDVEDAALTADLVKHTYTASGKHPPFALLWSRVSFAFTSTEVAALEAQVASVDIPVVGRLHDRTGYKAIFSFNTTLDRLPPKEVRNIATAIDEADELAAAVTKMIVSKQEVAA